MGASTRETGSQPSVNSGLTFPLVETPKYLAATERFIRAAGRRVAFADEPELIRLYGLHAVVDEAMQEAVSGWRGMGRTWSEIGGVLGISRQAAEQRYGKRSA